MCLCRQDYVTGADDEVSRLVPERVCKTPCKVYRTDGLNRDGSKKQTVIFEGKCFHSEKSRQELSADKQLITLSGEALFCGDIAPIMLL